MTGLYPHHRSLSGCPHKVRVPLESEYHHPAVQNNNWIWPGIVGSVCSCWKRKPLFLGEIAEGGRARSHRTFFALQLLVAGLLPTLVKLEHSLAVALQTAVGSSGSLGRIGSEPNYPHPASRPPHCSLMNLQDLACPCLC